MLKKYLIESVENLPSVPIKANLQRQSWLLNVKRRKDGNKHCRGPRLAKDWAFWIGTRLCNVPGRDAKVWALDKHKLVHACNRDVHMVYMNEICQIETINTVFLWKKMAP